MDNRDLEQYRAELKTCILELERDRAVEILHKLSQEQSYKEVITQYLEPVLADVGEQWVRNEITLAQGYVAGKIAEDLLEKAIESEAFLNEEEKKKPPVVLGNIEDDFHSFGRHMVSTFLKLSGWEVHDLGNDVTPEEFVKKAKEVNAVIIGASAMMYTTAENIKKLRTEMDNQEISGNVKLAVGGAVFKLRPELVKEVGGDGTADSAINAVKLFDNLYKELQEGDLP